MRSVWFAFVALLLVISGCISRGEATPTATAMRPPAPSATTRVTPILTMTPPIPSLTPSPSPTVIPSTPTPRLVGEATLDATPGTYVVQAGDTLLGIALAHGVTVDALVDANALASADVIFEGQVLHIPAGSTGPVVSPTLVPTATLALTLTPAPTQSPLTPALITHGDRTHSYVALTFDACQTATNPAGYDTALIDVLIETQTPATLFLGGLWMQSHPTQTQALAANELFELGNHSWSHPDFAGIAPEAVTREITMTQDMLFTLTGRVGTLFRLPFGTYTDETLTLIARQGLYTIQWDVESGDPNPNLLAEDLIARVTSQAQNGSIIIMHMNGRGWHTAEALPTIIETLRAEGYKLVTVSQLLELEPLPTP